MTAHQVVEAFGLEELDREGGWFRRIHTGAKNADGRPYSTTILALFTRERFSALHRLDAVEQFFFLKGDAFEAFEIDAAGRGRVAVLGDDWEQGHTPHLTFEPGSWFGGIPLLGGPVGWTLMSCVVTPGFEWGGFELGKRAELVQAYPNNCDAIERLTR